jgi:7-cyano-7-deazaguanine reductase
MAELILGQTVATPDRYAPEVLCPIPRQTARAALGLSKAAPLPFYGEDVWHAYELSWLTATGAPACFLGRLVIPAQSPMLVESKSLKLYLNSLNGEILQEVNAVARVQRDVSAVVGTPVGFELQPLHGEQLGTSSVPGDCLDGLVPTVVDPAPAAERLRCLPESAPVREVLHSHLFRSLCPVTAAPDWATVIIDYTGAPLDRPDLLSYLLSFRQHREFHEQCVERLFLDLWQRCRPQRLSVQAHYTRRGGLDINPYRSSSDEPAPRRRLMRQ